MRFILFTSFCFLLMSCTSNRDMKPEIEYTLASGGRRYPVELFDFSPMEPFRVSWTKDSSDAYYILFFHMNEDSLFSNAQVISLNSSSDVRDTLIVKNLNLLDSMMNVYNSILTSRSIAEFPRDSSVFHRFIYIAESQLKKGQRFVRRCNVNVFQECRDLERVLNKMTEL